MGRTQSSQFPSERTRIDVRVDTIIDEDHPSQGLEWWTCGHPRGRHTFCQTPNGDWQTDHVPPGYLSGRPADLGVIPTHVPDNVHYIDYRQAAGGITSLRWSPA